MAAPMIENEKHNVQIIAAFVSPEKINTQFDLASHRSHYLWVQLVLFYPHVQQSGNVYVI